MGAPRMAGPVKNSKFEPPMAPFLDDIMSSVEMKAEAMWWSGVKNPEPGWVAAAIMASSNEVMATGRSALGTR